MKVGAQRSWLNISVVYFCFSHERICNKWPTGLRKLREQDLFYQKTRYTIASNCTKIWNAFIGYAAELRLEGLFFGLQTLNFLFDLR